MNWNTVIPITSLVLFWVIDIACYTTARVKGYPTSWVLKSIPGSGFWMLWKVTRRQFNGRGDSDG